MFRFKEKEGGKRWIISYDDEKEDGFDSINLYKQPTEDAKEMINDVLYFINKLLDSHYNGI